MCPGWTNTGVPKAAFGFAPGTARPSPRTPANGRCPRPGQDGGLRRRGAGQVVAFPARATALAASGRRSYRRQPVELDAQFFVDGTQHRRFINVLGLAHLRAPQTECGAPGAPSRHKPAPLVGGTRDRDGVVRQGFAAPAWRRAASRLGRASQVEDQGTQTRHRDGEAKFRHLVEREG